MKALLLGIFALAFIPSLIAQDTLEEEVFPLMYNSPPSYVCCENCDEYITTFSMTVGLRAIKDTVFNTFPYIRNKDFKWASPLKHPIIFTKDFDAGERLRRFKAFEIEKRSPSHPKTTYLDTFYLRKYSNHLDIVTSFWLVTPLDTILFSGQLPENGKSYPVEQLFHTVPSIPYKDQWVNAFLGFFTYTTNLAVNYNAYIEDSVYTIRFESPEGPYDISTIYLSYKYGFLGFITQYPHPFRHRLIECETWFPPFHSPTFRKEENPPVKE